MVRFAVLRGPRDEGFTSGYNARCILVIRFLNSIMEIFRSNLTDTLKNLAHIKYNLRTTWLAIFEFSIYGS